MCACTFLNNAMHRKCFLSLCITFEIIARGYSRSCISNANVWKRATAVSLGCSERKLASNKVLFVHECALCCHQHSQCMSFNVEEFVTDREKICELTGKLIINDTKLTPMPGMSYFRYASKPLKPLGCFRDQMNPRPLPIAIANFRNEIDWYDMDTTILKCAIMAKKQGYSIFGVEFYGECWSGKDAANTYMKDGATTDCWSGVGKGNTIFVYAVEECV